MYYDYILPTYGSDKARLLFTDTDSLTYHIKTENLHDDMYLHVDKFDTSNFPQGHRLHSTDNRWVVGKFRSETAEVGLDRLLTFGGFPEPLLKGSPRFFRRWQAEYRTLLTKEDVRDLSRIQDIRGIEQLVEMLPARVGSPLSVNSLREDMGYHHGTVMKWIDILRELYLVFTLRPWHRSVVRSIKKEPKLYFVDWSAIPDPAIRFENLCAVALVRMAARLTETGVGRFEVMFIRDKEKREVDFVLGDKQRPIALFEAKDADLEIAPSGRYFSNKLGIPYYQIVRHCKKAEAFPGNCFVIPAAGFFMLCG